MHLFTRSLTLLCLLAGFNSFAEETSPRREGAPRVIIVYSVGDLAVYRADESGKPVFDASLLIQHLKQTIDPESWKSGASVVSHSSSKALIVSQTKENHEAIAQILYRMHLFGRPMDQRAIEDAITQAKKTNRRVLICVTEPSEMACERFMKTFESELRSTVASHYVLVGVRNDRLDELPMSWREKLSLQKDELLVVGKDAEPLSRLTLDDSINEQSIFDFLSEWVVSLESANVVLDQALRNARADDKLVLLVHSGPACVHCDQLKAFLKAYEPQLKKDYLPVIIDTRMEAAAALTQRLGRTDNEIPWFAILSEEGKSLANSESEFGNIGFPVERDGWLHFYRMIEQTRRQMSDEELKEVFGSLIAERAGKQ